MGAAISSMCGLADDEKQLIAGLARRGTAYKDEGNLKQDIFDALIHLASMDEYACVPQFVEIGVRCSNLPREDRFSLSDPMVIIYEKSAGSIWREQGRTELIMNNLNPVFLQHIQVMVRPGQDQQLMVKVIDLDGDVDERFVEAEHCTSLATVECSMEALLSTVGNKDKCLVLPDNPEQTANHLCVALYAEYVSRPRGRVDCKFSALHIHVDEKTSTDGKPALLYEILREVPPANSAPGRVTNCTEGNYILTSIAINCCPCPSSFSNSIAYAISHMISHVISSLNRGHAFSVCAGIQI